MNISVGYFTIACGIVLFVLSIRFLLTGRLVEMVRDDFLAISPLGTPLLAGPAIIATLLLLSLNYAVYIVLISFTLNLILAWIIFYTRDKIISFMGIGGLKAVGNIFNLLLAAIAVSMILRGLNLLGIIS